MTKTKKTDPDADKKIDWIEKGWTDALGVDGLWADIKSKLDNLGDFENTSDRGFDAETCPSNSTNFTVKHPDGRRVEIGRDGDRIIIEVADRKGYDRKVQPRLRRSFVEPKAELLAKEIVRQFELLLGVFTPIWNEREDVKAKADQDRKVRHTRSLELAEILLAKSKKGRELAVALP